MRCEITRQRCTQKPNGSGREGISKQLQGYSNSRSRGVFHSKKSLHQASFITSGLVVIIASVLLLLKVLLVFEIHNGELWGRTRYFSPSIEELTAGIMEVPCHKIHHPGRKSKSLASRLMDLPDRPEWKTCPFDKEFTRFIVFSEQHSGTMWLSGILNSHPLFYHVHEILCCDGYEGFSITRWQEIYFNHVCRRASMCGNATFAGFGVQSNQGWGNISAVKEIAPFYARTNTKVLFLHRTNTIEHQLSGTGVSRQAIKEGDSLTTLDSNFLRSLRNVTEERLASYETTRELLERWNIPTLYVTYEDLRRRKADAIVPIFEFLGVDTSSWKSASNKTTIWDPHLDWRLTLSSKKKHHRKALKDRVGNYDEALATLEEVYPDGACMLRGDGLH